MARNSTRRFLPLASILAASLAACASLQPEFRPTLADLTVESDEHREVHVLASLASLGADAARGTPAGIEARMRLRNESSAPVELEPRALELVSADLKPLGAPRVDPCGGVKLAPGESALLTALFPLPEGESAESSALRALNLRWTLRIGEESVSRSTTFERIDRARYVAAYPDPWWYSSPWGYPYAYPYPGWYPYRGWYPYPGWYPYRGPYPYRWRSGSHVIVRDVPRLNAGASPNRRRID